MPRKGVFFFLSNHWAHLGEFPHKGCESLIGDAAGEGSPKGSPGESVHLWGFCQMGWIWNDSGVNYNDLTATEAWKSWLGFGESSPNGRTIQVSEILSFTQMNDIQKPLWMTFKSTIYFNLWIIQRWWLITTYGTYSSFGDNNHETFTIGSLSFSIINPTANIFCSGYLPSGDQALEMEVYSWEHRSMNRGFSSMPCLITRGYIPQMYDSWVKTVQLCVTNSCSLMVRSTYLGCLDPIK